MNFFNFTNHGGGGSNIPPFGGEIPFNFFMHNNNNNKVKNKGTKLYKDLGLPPGSDIEKIKKTYRSLAMIHHPDKGGDPDYFKTIVHAQEILTDEKTKKIYVQIARKVETLLTLFLKKKVCSNGWKCRASAHGSCKAILLPCRAPISSAPPMPTTWW